MLDTDSRVLILNDLYKYFTGCIIPALPVGWPYRSHCCAGDSVAGTRPLGSRRLCRAHAPGTDSNTDGKAVC